MNTKKITLKLFFLTILSLLMSCGEDKTNLTIPEDKFIKIVYDIYAADNAIKEAPKEKRDSLKQIYTKQIFQIHNISQKEFEQNLNKLKNNPEKFKKFYDKLDKYAEDLTRIKTDDDMIPEDKK